MTYLCQGKWQGDLKVNRVGDRRAMPEDAVCECVCVRARVCGERVPERWLLSTAAKDSSSSTRSTALTEFPKTKSPMATLQEGYRKQRPNIEYRIHTATGRGTEILKAHLTLSAWSTRTAEAVGGVRERQRCAPDPHKDGKSRGIDKHVYVWKLHRPM